MSIYFINIHDIYFSCFLQKSIHIVSLYVHFFLFGVSYKLFWHRKDIFQRVKIQTVFCALQCAKLILPSWIEGILSIERKSISARLQNCRTAMFKSCPGVLPICYLIPDLTQNFFPVCSSFPPSLSISRLPPSSLLSHFFLFPFQESVVQQPNSS